MNADQKRMLEQKPELLAAMKEYEEIMTHINRIEQEVRAHLQNSMNSGMQGLL